METNNKKQEFDSELYYISLERAIDVIAEVKEGQPKSRCRLETTVHKESVTVYVIEKSKIC